jgi:hypothetical protein
MFGFVGLMCCGSISLREIFLSLHIQVFQVSFFVHNCIIVSLLYL